MDISYISSISASFLCIFILFKLDKSRQKQIDSFRDQFKDVLSIVGSLRFRVLDHERQLMNKEGTFIPEESAIFMFNLMWSILDEETKENIEKEYKVICPDHIPLWKYVLYAYKMGTKVERKIELKRIETVEEILIGDLNKSFEMIDEVKKKMEQVKEIENEMNSLNVETNELRK